MKNSLIGLLIVTVIVLLVFTVRGCGSAPDAAAVRELMTEDQIALGGPIVNSIGMVLVPIPAGEFQMGSPPSDKPERNHQARLQHLVTMTQPYYLGSFEVTQQQYEDVMGERPWEGQPLAEEGSLYAATYVSWEDATEFCKKLSDQEGVTYRLPTEAEWEYACRAGTDTTYSFGDDGGELGAYAWIHGNAYAEGQQYAHMVGQKLPNAWGLYDMHGNVWEWCGDWFAHYSTEEATDPTGPAEGRHRVWRGGGFQDHPGTVRCAIRNSEGRAGYRPEFVAGFRVVQTMSGSASADEGDSE